MKPTPDTIPADTIPPHGSPDLSATAALVALTRATARNGNAGARGLYSRWRADPAGHATTALVTVLCLAAMVLANVALGQDAAADDGPEAAATRLFGAVASQQTPGAVDAATPTPQAGAVPEWGAGLPASVTRWAGEIEAAVAENPAPGLTPRLVACMAHIESGGQVAATSSAGASGILQIHPPSHPDYDVARGIREPAYNIGYGVAFLSSLIRRTGSVRTAVCQYNGGGECAGYAESQRYMTYVLPCSEAQS